MKILVTGANGFLGRRIVASLLAAGADDLCVHVRDRASEALLDEWHSRHPQARIEVRAANLLSRTRLPALVEGVDCIVHAAAGMRGSAADMFANTVVGTRNLLDAAGAAGVRRIVLVSSFAVYRTEQLERGARHDEQVPIEATGIEKGAYAYAKTRQEHLFEEYRRRFGFEAVVLRPGVIYGPGGGRLSNRVGLRAMGVFFSLGGAAELPLTYVDNCADAVALAALKAADGARFNVVDDDLPTCRAYLRGYRREVEKLRVLPVPYWAFVFGSSMLLRYHKASKGQLPAVFTPYIVRSMYRPLQYSNAALKSLGWTPKVATAEGLQRSFRYWRDHPA